MERLTAIELLRLPFGSKILVIWYNSKYHEVGEKLHGVIFGDKIGWEDGKIDRSEVISECLYDGYCKVYLG